MNIVEKIIEQTVMGKDVARACALLGEGEVVAIPTETVYGLAANAFNEQAVHKIFTIKGRPFSNPLIVHIAGFEQAQQFTEHIPEAAYKLMELFSPGPLTVVLPKNELIPEIVTAGLPDVAIRIPDHPLTIELLKTVSFPLAAPSANPFGYISPTSAAHVHKMLAGKIKYILDGGTCKAGIESTIVGFPNGMPTIYREGVITRAEIEKTIGRVEIHRSHKSLAPGMLPGHYQPNTPVVLCDDVDCELAKHKGIDVGLITYNTYSDLIPENNQILLCSGFDLIAAANRLYSAMHDMDERGCQLIIIKKLPDMGIGIAINDRLKRASYR